MHELSIAQSILSIVQEEMGKHNLTKLHKVVIKNGQLAGVVTESLQFAWETLIQDTPLDNAEMVIEDVPLTLKCVNCGTTFSPEHAISSLMPCPECSEQIGHEVIGGKELFIENLDAE